MLLSPYLHFQGNAAEAMHFYRDIFDAQIVVEQKFSEAPAPYECPDAQKNWLMHGFIKRGNNEMMFSDSPEKMTVGNNVYTSIKCESEQEISSLYEKLSTGTQKINVPLQDMFRGAKFAGLIDKFGVAWYLNWDKPKTNS